MLTRKELKKPRIGIYPMGLKHYWEQFPGLSERLLQYGKFISRQAERMGGEIYFYGLVDCEQEGQQAGEYFNQKNVDLILAHSATYVTSASVLPVHQICTAPTIILNLQPAARILAMKICDILDKGGSFCEIVATDYEDGTILLGHDGPFHLKIAKGKPILRGMGLYHGKQGTGVSVEAKVQTGDITNLACTQTIDGKLKFIITEAESTDGPIMTIGNTQTPVRFKKDPDSYMDDWFAQAPTHHFAMSIGHNASLFKKAADLLEIESVQLANE